ncbi:hypothetical protein TgHK011_007096 [Trichoderma gracile]|nr:hypothetical protein TgHK011_007096 [Trichoderma gracile]
MPVKYIFTESAPSQTTYFRSGRGGAGNTFRTSSALPSTATSTASSSTATTSTTTTQPRHLPNQRFFSGIGGAGNVHQANELQSALLESLETSPPLGNPERGHVGRGGAGNVYGSSGGGRRKTSDAGSSVSSAGSVASSVSEKAKAWASRVGGAFARK